ncbi:imidazole glycerol phosphate synthase subunit HisH [Maritalea myrionectae]|uniref:Imidazole glycerol phosphate synthase subunit HisH n=1 Tax=Maritalea myrionectae TaxID=454601 RepID=A0A2R4M9X4_9HYPH|nr:imidazole glycerol phosphate synthase subunit HisH [Maritalea myrionectae]AVX02820.1 imidazole glycerol phosphate synthase subunit HisH [Maritalea myrionectae]
MSEKIIIVDYGAGNLKSAHKAVERAATTANGSFDVRVSDKVEDVKSADRVILPGVGAFADCRNALFGLDGMVDALEDHANKKMKPFLGICVGMQLLASKGLEKQVTEGLGWIPGTVEILTPNDPTLKVPHMGWNNLDLLRPHPVFDHMAGHPHAYFVHSYHYLADNPDHVIATFNYDGPHVAAIGRDNIVASQFHPEKSQAVGLTMIENFLNWKI